MVFEAPEVVLEHVLAQNDVLVAVKLRVDVQVELLLLDLLLVHGRDAHLQRFDHRLLLLENFAPISLRLHILIN